MLVIPVYTQALVVSRSRTLVSRFSDLVLNGTAVEVVSELKILGVTLDSKMTLESQLRSVPASASSWFGVLRKTLDISEIPLWLPSVWGTSYSQFLIIAPLSGYSQLFDPIVFWAVNLSKWSFWM